MKFKTFQEFKEWNEQMFKKYNNERVYLHPNPVLRFIEKSRIRTILSLAKIKNNDRVLEVGCGEGYILNLINNGKLYGIDLSNTAIARAKQKLASKTNVKKLIIGPAEKLPFKPKSFDVIICSEVIEHVQNPRRVLQELARVAKPNARIVVTFPNEALINKLKQIVFKIGLFELLLKNVPKRMDNEWHLHVFNITLFKKLIQNKLKIIKIKGIPFFFLPIRYIVKCRIF